MTSVMLATYPEVFAGGAIVAGLPYGAATSVAEAFESCSSGRPRSARGMGRHRALRFPASRGLAQGFGLARRADATVTPVECDGDRQAMDRCPRLAVAARPGGRRRRLSAQASGGMERAATSSTQYTITGMAHGTPLAVADGSPLGVAGPFFIDAGISSTYSHRGRVGPDDAPRPQGASPSRGERTCRSGERAIRREGARSS